MVEPLTPDDSARDLIAAWIGKSGFIRSRDGDHDAAWLRMRIEASGLLDELLLAGLTIHSRAAADHVEEAARALIEALGRYLVSSMDGDGSFDRMLEAERELRATLSGGRR